MESFTKKVGSIGKIVVTANHSTKLISGTNRITHDDYTRSISIHKIEAFVGSSLWRSCEVEKESELLLKADSMTNELEQHLEYLKSSKGGKTLSEKIKELGFND